MRLATRRAGYRGVGVALAALGLKPVFLLPLTPSINDDHPNSHIGVYGFRSPPRGRERPVRMLQNTYVRPLLYAMSTLQHRCPLPQVPST